MQAMREMNGEYIVECVYMYVCEREGERRERDRERERRRLPYLIQYYAWKKNNFNFEQHSLF